MLFHFVYYVFLRLHYPHILLENIVGHSEIAPVRKTDPGKSFNWKAFKASLE